jgi:hypothetical protein
MSLDNVNFLGALLGAVAAMAIGALWYSPVLFANRWQALIGKTDDELGNAGSAMAIAAVAFLLMGIGMSWVIPNGSSVGEALMWGFLGFWGLALPAIVVNSAFERRSWALVGLYLGYLLLAMLAMAAIIGFLGG